MSVYHGCIFLVRENAFNQISKSVEICSSRETKQVFLSANVIIGCNGWYVQIFAYYFPSGFNHKITFCIRNNITLCVEHAKIHNTRQESLSLSDIGSCIGVLSHSRVANINPLNLIAYHHIFFTSSSCILKRCNPYMEG